VDENPPAKAAAAGERSVAAAVISGVVVTGDHAVIDQRRVEVAPGTLPDPAQVNPGSLVSNLPRPPARVFAGRDDELRQLASGLSHDGVVSVYGSGGTGKSELALQHARRHRGDYRVVWWITATDAAQVKAGLARLAERLCPAIAVAGNTENAAEWAVGWLQAHDHWLLILDNVDDPEDARSLIALLPDGQVIVTTRRDAGWQRVATPLRVDVLDPGDAARIILARTGSAPTSLSTATQIGSELGCLPLALDQAAAYIAQTRISLDAYLTRLREHPASMLQTSAAGEAGQTIARLWDITIEAIQDRDPEAVRLLQVVAHYAPDNIPRVLASQGDHQLQTDQALGLLASYSMITLTEQDISIHRLIRAVILSKLQPAADEGMSARDTALDYLQAALPKDRDDPRGWPLFRAVVPHVESLAEQYTPGERPEELGWVLNSVGIFLHVYGDDARAVGMLESAAEIMSATAGPAQNPEHTATQLGNLVLALCGLGRAEDALPLAERTLAMAEAVMGPDHPALSLPIGNLAEVLSALGRDVDALPLKQRALDLIEGFLDPGHPDVAVRQRNLASTLKDLGRPADALLLEERALATTEAALGPDHPETGTALTNMAQTLLDLGRSKEAIPMQERALAITKASYGPDNPEVATVLGNLATTLTRVGRTSAGLRLAQQALAITEAALGPDHPTVAIRLAAVASAWRGLGNLRKALPLEERALAITEAALGPDHPKVAVRLWNLAITLGDLKRPAEALPLAERALAINEASQGSDHPDLSLGLWYLAKTLKRLGRPADALPLAERALAITEDAYDPDHPAVATRLNNLAAVYDALGRKSDAKTLKSRARDIIRASKRRPR